MMADLIESGARARGFSTPVRDMIEDDVEIISE